MIILFVKNEEKSMGKKPKLLESNDISLVLQADCRVRL